ncbi:MAG: PLP-dependent aminotransferase family protein [Vicinamibacterales bacterium]
MNYDQLLSRAGERMQQSAIRQMGTVAAENPDVISFAPGYPSPEAFDWSGYREIASRILAGHDPSALQYGPTRGYAPLLEFLVALLESRGIRADPDHVLVTTGSQQGLDLVGRVLLDPGDVVLVELPSYTGAITAFRNAQAKLVGIPQGPDGISLEALEDITRGLRQSGRRIKFLYVVPNFQNPTGLLVDRPTRLGLVDWATRHDLLIVEDDPYGELLFDDSLDAAATRPLKADDESGRVIYLSSFSKTLAPGFRTAFMTAPGPLTYRFETAKQTLDLCTGNLDQHMVYEACRSGLLERQVPRLRALYRRKRDLMEVALRAHLPGLATWRTPKGGFFLWIVLPEGIDTGELLAQAFAKRVIYVAGQPFFVDHSGRNTLRLAFSFVDDDRITAGIARLGATILTSQLRREPV